MTDLSADLTNAWQLVDFAVRQIGKALRTGGFYQQPEAEAALRAYHEDGKKIVASYSTAEKTMGAEKDGPRTAPPDAGEAPADDDAEGGAKG